MKIENKLYFALGLFDFIAGIVIVLLCVYFHKERNIIFAFFPVALGLTQTTRSIEIKTQEQKDIYSRWFKFGSDRRSNNTEHPNRYLNVVDGYRISYEYNLTFKESLPWNRKWTWIGYRDGYYFCGLTNSIDEIWRKYYESGVLND